MNCEAKHAVHCTLFLAWIIGFLYSVGALSSDTREISPLQQYGLVPTIILYTLKVLSLLVLPQCICNLVGLTIFNAFREKVQLKAAPLLAPFICFRVVTKGLYPRLVSDTVKRNMDACNKAGMTNFMFEVVTDNRLKLESRPKLREVVVPPSYETKSGAKFKARALQYCLEDDVNQLQDSDWIVHLDEETLLTMNSICGILNFCEEGRHEFGQGLITYANGEIVNWLTTLSDSFRVADDMGKLRLQLKMFHKPLFGWKGSFVVTKYSAEREVSFDHGLEGSIAEDCYFSMVAMKMGYSFNFIEGEMLEKSPFTMSDFLQQRKRWLQGILLTVRSEKIGIYYKTLLALSLYAWTTMPVTTLQVFLCPLFPLPKCYILDVLLAFVGAVNLYMYMYGVVKSFSNRYRKSLWKLVLYAMGACIAIPFNVIIENLAVMVGLFGDKKQFYIVQKERLPLTIV